MKLLRKVGATSEIWQIFIADSSSTTGAGLTGLTNASASLTAYYHRDTDTTATAISLVAMTVGTFTSSGFKEIDATNMPGWYQFCPPDAALASGASSCAFHLKGATNMAPLPIEVDLRGEPASVTGAVGSVTGAVGSVTGAVGSVTGAVGSVTGNVGGNVVGSVASVTAAVTLTSAYDFAKGTAAMTESYAALNASMTPVQALHLLVAYITNLSISGTTFTAKKLDGTTTAATGTLNSSTNPTQNLRAS